MFNIDSKIQEKGFTRNTKVTYVWHKDGIDWIPRYWLNQQMPFSKQQISLLFSDKKMISSTDMVNVGVGGRSIYLVKKEILEPLLKGKLDYDSWKQQLRFQKAVEKAGRK